MRIEINVKKKHVFVFSIFVSILSFAFFAYGLSTNSPVDFGHNISEIDFSGGLPQGIRDSLIGPDGDKGDKGPIGASGSCSISITNSYKKSINTQQVGWYGCGINEIMTGVDYKNSGDDYIRGLYCSKISSVCT